MGDEAVEALAERQAQKAKEEEDLRRRKERDDELREGRDRNRPFQLF